MSDLKIDNIDVLKKRLGRLQTSDYRDRYYPVPRKSVPSGLRMKFYPTGPILDQGMYPRCVEYAGIQFLRTGPVHNKIEQNPGEIYHECQLVDEWDGEDYDGTSVRALMKVLQSRGYISEYQWAWDIGTVINHVLTTGPMVVGTDWLSDMFDVRDGFIRATGYAVGGHAYLIKGINLDHPCPDGSLGAFRLVNSWGHAWGNGPVGGLAWISIVDMAKLLANWGEAATATEIVKG